MVSLFLLVSVVSCNEEVLILEDVNQQYNIDFFNLVFYSDENRIEACKYLAESESISLEKEPLAKNSYYIYTDDQLFQEIAVEKEWAKINLNYHEYLHHIEKDEMIISIEENHINTNNHSILILTILFSLFLVSISLFILMSKM